jgi:CIC family chloride channel protein
VLFGHEDLAGIIFWAALVGFCGAIVSVAFREAIRLIERLLTGEGGSLVHAATQLEWWQRATIPALGGLAAGLVLYAAGRTLRSPKAVDYMEAILVGDGKIGSRITIVRSVSSLFSIASGGSIGREGPMVQLAAMIASKLGRLVRTPVPRLRLMVACGGAAGIAAAYNAPISGALFISEIVMGSIGTESLGPLVVASVTANATIHKFLGYGPLFEVPHLQFASNWELIFYALMGVLLGHLAPPFLALLDSSKALFTRIKLPIYFQLGLGGLIVGLVSIALPQVWGNGYSVVGDILRGDLIGLLLLAVLAAKVLTISATVGSGAVGGIFTPTLFVGSAIGALVGGLLHQLLPDVVSTPAAYALTGMGGFLAATTHAPLTAILMLFEMTLDYEIVLPLMLTCVIAHYTAKVYRGGESVYHASLKRASDEADSDDWRLRTVETLVKPAAAVVISGTSLKTMFEQLPKRPLERVYVVDDEDVIAWLDPRAAFERLNKQEIAATTTVDEIAQPLAFSLTPEMPLCTALDGFLQEQATVLPVTPGQWRNTLLGEVSRRDVLLAVQDRLTYPK